MEHYEKKLGMPQHISEMVVEARTETKENLQVLTDFHFQQVGQILCAGLLNMTTPVPSVKSVYDDE